MASFNLVDRPWIPCVTVEGKYEEQSLLQVLTEPHRVREIVDPVPTITVALHRLLLAILHRALDGPRDEDEWAALWEKGRWDPERLRAYLETWRHRFDLFDADRPFYQSREVDLKYAAPVTKLTHEMASPSNGVLLFDHTLPERVRLSARAAARYLVAHQAFAVGGLVSGTGPQKYARAAPLCKAAVCLIKGPDLARTLILNLHRYDPERGEPFRYSDPDCEESAAWERDRGPGWQDRHPVGYVDLLTWQSRRILLLPCEEEVDGEPLVERVVIMKGDQLPKDWDPTRGETMIPVCRPDPKKPWLPLALQEERALWRDSLALVQTVRNQVHEDRQSPRTIQWLATLAATGVLPRRTVLPVDVYGLTTDRASVLFWRREVFPLPLAVLDDRALVEEVRDALDVAEKAAEAVRTVVRQIVRTVLPEGSQRGPELVRALAPDRRYWSQLERPFLEYLRTMGEQPPVDDQAVRSLRARWAREVHTAAGDAFRAAVASLYNTPRGLAAVAQHETRFWSWLASVAGSAA